MEGLQSETTEPSSLRPAADAAAAAAAANANPANADTAVAMVADGIQFERHSPVAGNTSHPTRLEGFWASSPRIEDDGYHGAYPWPTPSTQPWPRRTDWVGKLRLIQDAFEAAQTTRTNNTRTNHTRNDNTRTNHTRNDNAGGSPQPVSLMPSDGTTSPAAPRLSPSPPEAFSQISSTRHARPMEQAGLPTCSVFTYHAASACRLCVQSEAGSAVQLGVQEYDDATAQITWPEGLAHYVEVHHILPSLIFYEYVRDFPMNRIRQVLDAAEQKPLTRCGRICCWFQR